MPLKVAPVTTGAPGVDEVTLPTTATNRLDAPKLDRVMLPEGEPTGAEAARRTKTVAEALPPDCGIMVVDANEELFVETSKLAGAVAVMFAVRFVPLTVKDCAAEEAPWVVEKSVRVPLVVIVGTAGGGVAPEFLGLGSPVSKSAELSLVSCSPPDFRKMASVVFGAGAAAEPSKALPVPTPTKSMMVGLPRGLLPERGVEELTRASLKLFAATLALPRASGVGNAGAVGLDVPPANWIK